MDPQYKDIFSMLYYSGSPLRHAATWTRWAFEEPWFLNQVSGTIRQAIDEAETELLLGKQRRLRADAKYFLFLNLMDMVVVPILMRGEIKFEQLGPILRQDVALLVGEAAAREADHREVSGNAVLEAVAMNWRKLKLSDLRIWGEE